MKKSELKKLVKEVLAEANDPTHLSIEFKPKKKIVFKTSSVDEVELEVIGCTISSLHLSTPKIMIEYKYNTSDGIRGRESNSLKTFMEMIKE